MGEAFGRVVAIVFGILILLYIPLLIVGLKADNTSQAYIDNAVVEFVDNARATAKISPEAYEHLCKKIDSIQPFCEIQITHSEHNVFTDADGNCVDGYYDTGKIDILDYIYTETGENRSYEMKLGDFLNVTVYNVKPTLGTKLYRLFIPGYAPNNHVLYSTYSGYVGNYMEGNE
jgi:hypothetical protein